MIFGLAKPKFIDNCSPFNNINNNIGWYKSYEFSTSLDFIVNFCKFCELYELSKLGELRKLGELCELYELIFLIII